MQLSLKTYLQKSYVNGQWCGLTIWNVWVCLSEKETQTAFPFKVRSVFKVINFHIEAGLFKATNGGKLLCLEPHVAALINSLPGIFL